MKQKQARRPSEETPRPKPGHVRADGAQRPHREPPPQRLWSLLLSPTYFSERK